MYRTKKQAKSLLNFLDLIIWQYHLLTISWYKICHKSTSDFFLFILFQVIVSVLKPKKSTLFISEDEGETFESCPLSFTPHVVSCSPASDKLIVAHDQHANKVCGGNLSFLMIIFIRKFFLTDS